MSEKAEYVLDNLHTIDIGVGETGVTVRRGDKWFNRVSGGTSIQLQETLEGKSEVVGSGRVKDVWLGRFVGVPASLIEIEHEESSRTYSGLLASMRRAYGEEFSENDVVTVFSYERTS